MNPLVRGVVLSVVLALPLIGCSRGTNVPSTSAAGEALPNLQLVTDIPIPPNSTMDNDRSLILSDRDRWTGRVVLKQSQSPSEITAFYQQQMPNFGWQAVMSVASEISVMTYTRGDRAATVQVERGTVYGSTVLVTVAPRQSDSGAGATSVGYEPPSPRSAQPERIRSEPLSSPSRR
ncbi:MAG: hypothetical protein ACM31L_04840 [Actinomycetota bacterium]